MATTKYEHKHVKYSNGCWQQKPLLLVSWSEAQVLKNSLFSLILSKNRSQRMEADGQDFVPVGRQGKQSICKFTARQRVKGKRFSCMHKEFSDRRVTQVRACRGFLTQTKTGIALIVSPYSIYHLVNLYNCMLCFVSSSAISCSIYTLLVLCFSVTGVGNTKRSKCSCLLILVCMRVKFNLWILYHYLKVVGSVSSTAALQNTVSQQK